MYTGVLEFSKVSIIFLNVWNFSKLKSKIRISASHITMTKTSIFLEKKGGNQGLKKLSIPQSSGLITFLQHWTILSTCLFFCKGLRIFHLFSLVYMSISLK